MSRPALLAAVLIASAAFAQEGAPPAHAEGEAEASGPPVNWVAGPTKVDLGKDLAEIDVPEGFAFANADDTRKLLESMGNQTDGNELGVIVPSSNDESWFLLFTWDDVGYVKDTDKDKIDADALLASIKEATEDGNAWRKEHHLPALHVTGWAESPKYDEQSHNLVWATLAKNEEGHESGNYNMRLLGRRGVVSATLVESAAKLAASKPYANQLAKGFSFKSGSTYAEWRSGDKVAEYGLTALVAAGAGAAAVKLGLFGYLAKFAGKLGKGIVVLVVAIGSALSKLWAKLRGVSKSNPVEPPPLP